MRKGCKFGGSKSKPEVSNLPVTSEYEDSNSAPLLALYFTCWLLARSVLIISILRGLITISR